jgi:hypothetical protein
LWTHGLEFLRTKHGHEEIDEEKKGHRADNHRFHEWQLQAVTKERVSDAQEKKEKEYSNENKIAHWRYPVSPYLDSS